MKFPARIVITSQITIILFLSLITVISCANPQNAVVRMNNRSSSSNNNNNKTAKIVVKIKSAAKSSLLHTIPLASASTLLNRPLLLLAANNIHENIIPGSSDHVPVIKKNSTLTSTTSTTTTASPIPAASSESKSSTPSTTSNLTNSNANVFEAEIPNKNKDPLQVNAQQQNPFMTGLGGNSGGINPQIAMFLRNNPRLQMLARQNPIIAQQIMRNPQMLRDPMIQRAIQSQLAPGQGQSLLGQIGQLGINGLNGLGRALNPLGIGVGGNPMNRGAGGLGGLGGLGGGSNGFGNRQMQNKDPRNFGIPNQNRQNMNSNFGQNPHQDTLNGGYYGDNENYANQPNPETNEVDHEGGGEDAGNEDQGGSDPGHQDYGDNTGEENGGQDDGQSNPADDPDIQQLQNFGGPLNDNFPEGLFPPGLLSKEDIAEIRRQQEQQQREEEERQRRQQQQQNQHEESPDYENNGGEGAGEGGSGDENVGTEYPETEGVNHQDDSGNVGDTAGNENEVHNHNEVPSHHHQEDNNGHHHHHAGDDHHPGITQSPPAYKNAYQPIQPGHYGHQHHHHSGPNRLQNEYHHAPEHRGPIPKNQFNNVEPNVEYDHPHHHHHHGDPETEYSTTFAPPIHDGGKLLNNRLRNGIHNQLITPNHLRHNSFHNQQFGNRQMVNGLYPRPRLSQWTTGMPREPSTLNERNPKQQYPKASLFQNEDFTGIHQHHPHQNRQSTSNHHHQGPENSNYANILNNHRTPNSMANQNYNYPQPQQPSQITKPRTRINSFF